MVRWVWRERSIIETVWQISRDGGFPYMQDDYDLNQAICFSLKKSGYGVLGAAFMEKGLHQSGRHRFLQDFTVNRRCMTSLVLELPSFLPAGNLQKWQLLFRLSRHLAIVLLITHQKQEKQEREICSQDFPGNSSQKIRRGLLWYCCLWLPVCLCTFVLWPCWTARLQEPLYPILWTVISQVGMEVLWKGLRE